MFIVKGLLMPTWALIYCGLIVLSGFLSVYFNKGKASYYIPGELLSGLFTIGFFLLHFNVINKPSSILIPILMLIYVLYWELWENRHHYLFEARPNQSAEEFKVEQSFVIVFSIIFMIPILLVILKVISSY